MKSRYFVAYKPYNMLCQFRDTEGRATLSDLAVFPKDVYAVGRLDQDSEGLLILTNDARLNHRLLDPQYGHERTYWVQVEGVPSAEAMKRLEEGVTIQVDGENYHTRPARAFVFDTPPSLPPRNPPIRFRKTVPDTWISLTLTEGKNRQVRKMTAQVGHPTLRLVRAGIEGLDLGGLQPGEVVEVRQEEIFAWLFSRF
jgi:23S rRNA pseudouridine2457 synthase